MEQKVLWLDPDMEESLSDVSVENDMDLGAQHCDLFHDSETQRVQRDMDEILSKCDVEAKTQAVFQAYLMTQEAGLYRFVVRYAMVELERALRVKVNTLGCKFDFKWELKELATHCNFQDLYADIPHGLRLLWQLSRNAFASVKSGQKCNIVGTDLNRRAALHGLIPHNTKRESFKALVVSLYCFLLLCRVEGITLDP